MRNYGNYNFWYDTWDYGKFSGILRILIEYLATYEHILAPLWDKCLIDSVGILSEFVVLESFHYVSLP